MKGIMMKRFLVIGAGGAGTREAQIISEIVKNCEIKIWNTGKHDVKDKDKIRVITSERVALEFNPDFVFVATPTSTHIDYAQKFLDRAKAILIDKPMDASLNRCEVFWRNVNVSETKVYINFQRRYVRCWRKLKYLLEKKEFGQFLYGAGTVSSYYPDWRKNEDPSELYVARKDLGGGVLLTECHEIDLIQWCMVPIKSVSARMVVAPKEEVENQALLMLDLEFPYGKRTVNLILDDCCKHKKRILELFFERETILIDEEKGRIELKERGEEYEYLAEENPYRELLKAVLKELKEGETQQELPRLQDGLRVNAVIDAAKRSMATQRTCPVVNSICPKEGVPFLEEAISKLQSTFGKSLVAIYGMGSLGYGGYVDGWSDFDLDVLVQVNYEHGREAYQKGKTIEKQIKESGFDRIDIRVYNYEHLNERKTLLSYGQCSRAVMLCDSAILLAGTDVRNMIIRPTRDELNEEMVRLLKSMLKNDDDWWNSRPWDDVAAHFALMGRFLYTYDTGKVAGKQLALEYLLKNKAHLYSREEVQWVLWALACRRGMDRSFFQEQLHQQAVNILRGMFKRTLEVIKEQSREND